MVVLVVGGAKSGKSLYAQDLAKKLDSEYGKLYYVATMNPYDLEDMKRIENHIKEREGYDFETIEETLNMNIVAKAVSNKDTILLDSITSLLTNSMFRGEDFVKGVSSKIVDDLHKVINSSRNIVLVSDYVFCDSINYDCYTENFRKELGIVNRKIAKIADIVIEASFGNIIFHKGSLDDL